MTFGWVPELDERIGGLEPENLVVVAGENKAGKTTHAVNTVFANASAGKQVLVVTTEVSAKWYLFRLVCRALGYSLGDIKRGVLDNKQSFEVFKQLERFRNFPIRVADFPHCTYEDIRREVESTNPDLVVVDHFQRLDPWNENIAQGYKTLAQNLKQLAVTHSVPIMVLSQVFLSEGWFEYRQGSFQYTIQLMRTKWTNELHGEADKVLYLHNLGSYMPAYKGVGHVILHSLRDYEAGGGYIPVHLDYNKQYVGVKPNDEPGENRPY